MIRASALDFTTINSEAATSAKSEHQDIKQTI
jgi:hypothetical protein